MLITNQGEYIHTTFTGSNGTWRLIGSESVGESVYGDARKPWQQTSLGDTLDTFTNGNGQYNTIARRKVAELFRDKKIFLQ